MAKPRASFVSRGWHYALEFFVILLGITVSFYLEKSRVQSQNTSLKNQGLTRILQNVESDQREFSVNMAVHQEAARSCDWLFQHRHNPNQLDPDSLGHHCCVCLDGQTLFVDNQEEYVSLRNSGLLELIEDSTLVRMLQEKFVYHEYLHRLDDYNSNLVAPYRDLLFTHFELSDSMEFALDFVAIRRWSGTPLPGGLFQFSFDVAEWHMAYVWAMEEQAESDQLLIARLQSEIGVPATDQSSKGGE